MTTPTPLPTVASGPGSATASGTNSSSTSSAGTANPLSMVFVEVIGVGVLAGIASIGPRIGKLTVMFMVGILVLWMVTHATTLAKMLPGQNAPPG
jgi:hypothetical protein